jgi:large subunit ribosomal protein L9
MKVILTKDMSDLGDAGSVVSVSDGFARNYLFPQQFAIHATPGALDDLSRRQARLQAKAEKKHQLDLETAQELENLGQLTLKARSGDHGKLFGTVTTRELAKLLTDKSGLSIDRKALQLDNPINRLGEYSLSIKLSTKVSATLKVLVEADTSDDA